MDANHQGLALTLVYVLLSLFLVALNGFFVAAEFAFVKVRKSRLEELVSQGNDRAKTCLACVQQLDEYLSATQLGITLVSLALGWIGEHAFYRLLVITFPGRFALSESFFHTLSLSLSFFAITLLHVVLGELVPKSMAIQRAESVALRIARPLRWFYRMARPLIHVFTVLANLVLRVLGFKGESAPPASVEELRIVMRESRAEGVISDSESQIINRAFSFSDRSASDIMIPAERIQFLSLSRSLEENIAVTRKFMFTRFPLTGDGLHSIVGIVHMKDALQAITANHSNLALEAMARPALFIEPGLRQDKLMKLLAEEQVHMAIVRDEKTKQVLGLVTLEDILKSLVGVIKDEHGN